MKYTDQSIQQQIEAYLRQEMTDLERSGFERRMHDDDELHEEVQKQEAIIGAIRGERALALKSGLQNVSISLWSTGLMETAKLAAIVAGLGLASFGGYWWLLRSSNDSVKVSGSGQIELKQNNLEAPVTTPAVSSGLKSSDSIYSSVDQPAEVNMVPDAEPSTAGSKKNSDVNIKESVAKSNPHELRQNAEQEISEPGLKLTQPDVPKDINLPDDGITGGTRLESMQPELVIKRDNREKFHYQFSEGKLILYADFNEKLYEVLELNQHGQRQLYLAYDGKFFILDPGVSEITPLREVKDRNLIQILTVYQKKK